MAMRARTIETQKYYTAEEFMALSLDPGKRYELVRGVIEEMSHPGGEHMRITSNLSKALWRWIFSQAGGEPGQVLPPGGFDLKLNAEKDTVRSPDLAYLTAEKVAKLEAGAVEFPPDLAVEVYSPHDRPGLLNTKLDDYRAAGWHIVWVIYPSSAPKRKRQTVEVYHLQESNQPVKKLGMVDILSGEAALSGFDMPVKALFE